MRVVLDTNTLASGALAFTGSPAGAILDAWRDGSIVLVVSHDILMELTRVLAKPCFSARISTEDAAAFIELVAGTSALVRVAARVARTATHPEDDRILECAAVSGAAYLVTGDKKLLQLRQHEGVVIVSPRDFANLLQELRA